MFTAMIRGRACHFDHLVFGGVGYYFVLVLRNRAYGPINCLVRALLNPASPSHTTSSASLPTEAPI